MIWSFSWNVSAQNKIAIIDTGFNRTPQSKLQICQTGHKDFTGKGLQDNLGHGTHIANIIGNLVYKENYCAIIIKYINNIDDNKAGMENTLKAFSYLQDVDGLVAINYSSNGADYSFQEENLLLRLSNKGIKIFVAAGNHYQNLDERCNAFPSCYGIANVIPVGNLKDKETRNPSSNYGKIVSDWEIGTDIVVETKTNVKTLMSGTSQATAIATSLFLNRMK